MNLVSFVSANRVNQSNLFGRNVDKANVDKAYRPSDVGISTKWPLLLAISQ